MAWLRRKPGGVEFNVRIEDEAVRNEVGQELDALDIPFKVVSEGLSIEARGESAPEDVRKILLARGLRPPGSGPLHEDVDDEDEDAENADDDGSEAD